MKEPRILTWNNQQPNFFHLCPGLVTCMRTEKKNVSMKQPNLKKLKPY